jgi:TolB-like protein
MRLPAAILALGAAAGLAAPGAAWSAQRLAVLPFQTFSGGSAVLAAVASETAAALEARGFEVVAGEPVERFLAAERIRYLDSLTADQARRLSAQLGVDGLLLGAILVYEDRIRHSVPEFSVSARILSAEGTVLWNQVVSLRGSDTENGLGFGRIDEVERLVAPAVRRLLASVPSPLAPVRLDHLAGLFGLPRVFRSKVFTLRPGPIMVLPIQDFTAEPGAARIVEAVLQRNLARRLGLEVIEAAELRRAIVAEGLPSPAQMRPAELVRLARSLGTRYLLSGAVFSFGQGELTDGTPGREVEIYLSMVDLESGYVVWSGLHRRNGAEFEGLLKRGTIASMPMLADRVVAELIEALART